MIQTYAPVVDVRNVGPDLITLSLESRQIADQIQPGQFLNIKVNEIGVPFFRRPFSVYRRENSIVTILFGVIGLGTSILSHLKAGDTLDVLGPLGTAFNTDDNYDFALLVAGGLGVAPLPMVTEAALKQGKKIDTFLGARTAHQVVDRHLENLHVATDDGTRGYRGTVIDCLREYLLQTEPQRRKLFACGPMAMIKALTRVTSEFNIPAEVSLETVMACGIGLCQGCPVEITGGQKKYALICKEGPVFDIKSLRLI